MGFLLLDLHAVKHKLVENNSVYFKYLDKFKGFMA